jgi:hypothetical protein
MMKIAKSRNKESIRKIGEFCFKIYAKGRIWDLKK